MKRFFSRSWLAAGLVLAAVGAADAGSCGPAGCAAGYGGYGFNDAWMYPYGGFTPYPGEPGSCVPSHSDYSKVNWLVPPTATAQGVLNRLRGLGIPQVPPETIYLGKNPYTAGAAKLPVPQGWVPREDEPKAADPKDAEKLEVKPKAEKKSDDDE